VYSLERDVWDELPPLNQAIEYASSTLVKDHIFVTGSNVDGVFKFSPESPDAT
jgi:hypothetical protein